METTALSPIPSASWRGLVGYSPRLDLQIQVSLDPADGECVVEWWTACTVGQGGRSITRMELTPTQHARLSAWITANTHYARSAGLAYDATRDAACVTSTTAPGWLARVI